MAIRVVKVQALKKKDAEAYYPGIPGLQGVVYYRATGDQGLEADITVYKYRGRATVTMQVRSPVWMFHRHFEEPSVPSTKRIKELVEYALSQQRVF